MIDFEFAQSQIFRFEVGIRASILADRLLVQIVPELIDDLLAEALLTDAFVMLPVVHSL